MQLLDFDNADKLFPPDVIKRAKEYLDAIPGGTGAYSDSQGAPIIREQIAQVNYHTDYPLLSTSFPLSILALSPFSCFPTNDCACVKECQIVYLSALIKTLIVFQVLDCS